MKRSLRIAQVTEYYYPHLGGVTEHVQNLSQQLRARGHSSIVITSHMSREPERDPFVHRIGKSLVLLSNGSFARITLALGLLGAIESLLRDNEIDLVHVHGPLAPALGLVAPEAARRLGIPVVATFHSWFRRSVAYAVLQGPLQQRLDRFAARIAVSEPVVRALSRYFRSEWEIIPNGVNLSYFHPNGRDPGDARTHGPRLLFLGRLDPRNGLETVLAAMPRILARYPTAQLAVAGGGPLRPYYEIRARPLGDRVRFLGRVYEGRPDHYASADVYLCPTDKASFGITLLEAMASGTPIIASDIIGFRELAAGGAETVLVPPGDPAAWAEATIGLIADSARRAAMGSAGFAKAAGYSWPLVAGRILEVYEGVVR